ncbi:MAG: folylpolyglutamate synthase/dihydrofolate synthase family protein [Actinomycetaceae bacterium]|nr:folylpolyglutamate synthase/dihydrofolate synthase family protein [Actinomycetaceae bacterium]
MTSSFESPLNRFEQVKREAGEGGIDPELLPYIQASKEEDDQDYIIDSDSEDTAVVASLVKHSMLAGPLEEVVDEIVLTQHDDTVDEGDIAEICDELSTDDRAAFHSESLDEAAALHALDQKVNTIYQSIIARKPEHRPNPSLDRVRRVMEYMGDPHSAYPSIHITGTNGKTSVTRMIDALCTEQGLRTGRFTSPHLHTVRERIAIDNEPISREGFIAAYEDIKPIITLVDNECAEQGQAPLSFFEVLTAMAFQAFADAPVDVAIVEVGLGGTWDCTNVLPSSVQVLTPIDVDHQRWLGATVEEIARDKAGIIKPDSLVISGPQHHSVTQIISQAATAHSSVARFYGTDFQVCERNLGVGGQIVTLRTPAGIYEDVFLPLFGAHQATNAAVALTAFEAFMSGGLQDPTVVEHAMMNVSSPGRVEVVRSSPTVIVDACHNPAGATTLVDTLEESFAFGTVIGLFSAMKDKDVEGVLSVLEPVFEEIVLVEMPGERSMPLEQMRSIAHDVFGEDRVHESAESPSYEENTAHGIALAADLGEAQVSDGQKAGVVACGSVVFAADVRQACHHAHSIRRTRNSLL